MNSTNGSPVGAWMLYLSDSPTDFPEAQKVQSMTGTESIFDFLV
jgi:hypothetical protein